MEETSGRPKRIRVLVVDDHPVVRSGLGLFLLSCDDLALVGEAAGGEEAIEMCRRLHADVVLMDMLMPEMDGAEATKAIRRICPATQVIALTSFSDEKLIQSALQAGAIGYLLKNVSGRELVEAIRAAHIGRPTLAPEATKVLIESASQPSEIVQPLTERETAVLALMVRGLNNVEIANQLVVSRSTIKHHVSSILAKLGASTRTEAATLAVQRHLVT
jgi:two-component system, NarL family, response regulator LiaR